MSPVDPLLLALHRCIQLFMQRSMRGLLAYARQNGLSMSQLGAMVHIHHQGCSGVAGLGDELGVTSSAASQLLERLVQSGLALRSEDPSDRRLKQCVLTEQGRRVLDESMAARQGWLLDLAASLSDGEKRTVLAALHILIDKAEPAGPPLDADTAPTPGGD